LIGRLEASVAVAIFATFTTLGYLIYELFHTSTSPLVLTFWTFWPALLPFVPLWKVHGIIFNLPDVGRRKLAGFVSFYAFAWLGYWYSFWVGIGISGPTFALSILSLMIIATPLGMRFVEPNSFPPRLILISVLLVLSLVLIRINGSYSEISSEAYWQDFLHALFKRDQLFGMALLFLTVIFHALQEVIALLFVKQTKEGPKLRYFCIYRNGFADVVSFHMIFLATLLCAVISGVALISAHLLNFEIERHSSLLVYYGSLFYLGAVPAAILIIYLPYLETAKKLNCAYIVASLSIRPIMYLGLVTVINQLGVNTGLSTDTKFSVWLGFGAALLSLILLVFPAYARPDGFQRRS
jgi:hypothetical protein